jgi:hypothetical protein
MDIARLHRSSALRVALLAVAAPLALAGCQMNPFIESYRGEKLAPVPAARIVTEPPAEGTAREIGTCKFSASMIRTPDESALDAARAVGADLVMWNRGEMTEQDWIENDPVYQRRAAGRGDFASYMPIPGSRDGYKYTARFWQSITASTPGSASGSTPGSASAATSAPANLPSATPPAASAAPAPAAAQQAPAPSARP